MAINAADIAAPAAAPPRPGFWQTAIDVLFAPARACDAIARRRRAALLPLALLIVSFTVLWSYYYYHVDFAWLTERMIDGFMNRGGNASRQNVEAGFKNMTPGLMLGVTLVSGGLAIVIILALRAFYLGLIAKLVARQSPPFASWFALSVWAALPTVLSVFMGLANLLTHDPKTMMPAEVAVTSANRLFFHLPDTHRWAAMSDGFDLLLLWSFVIMGVGFSRWTGVGIVVGQLVALLPLSLLYGIWALATWL